MLVLSLHPTILSGPKNQVSRHTVLCSSAATQGMDFRYVLLSILSFSARISTVRRDVTALTAAKDQDLHPCRRLLLHYL